MVSSPNTSSYNDTKKGSFDSIFALFAFLIKSRRVFWSCFIAGILLLTYTIVNEDVFQMDVWPIDLSLMDSSKSSNEVQADSSTIPTTTTTSSSSSSSVRTSGKEKMDCHMACCSKHYLKSSSDTPTIPSFHFSNSIENGTKAKLFSHHGLWIGPKQGGWSVLTCNVSSDTVGFYTFIQTGPQTYRILTPIGTYLSASDNNGVNANETDPGPSSEFKLIQVKGKGFQIHLKAYDGLFLGCLEDGGLFRWSDEPQAWEAFQVWKTSSIPNLRGVTLAGWLVLESWMTPYFLGSESEVETRAHNDLPSGLGLEYRILKSFKHGKGKKMLLRHYESYITEKDFRRMAKENLNTVNIPVGWWVVKFSSELPQWDWVRTYVKVLDAAMDMASKHRLRVFLTLSARPGPEENPVMEGQSLWGVFPEAVEQVLKAIEWLSIRYGHHKALLGLSILNQDLGLGMPEDVQKNYFQKAYEIIRSETFCAYLAMSPGMGKRSKPLTSVMNPNQTYYNVLSEVFFEKPISEAIGSDFNGAMKNLKSERLNAIEDAQEEDGSMALVGEWSMAVKSEAQFSKTMILELGKAQLGVYRRAKAGWLFRSVKIPEPGLVMSNFFDTVKQGYLPKQPNGGWD